MSLTKVTYSMIEGAVANVLDFGATGDGTTDDTVAIQAAIDSLNAVPKTTPTGENAGGGTVYFPAGTYKVTAQDAYTNAILVPCNIKLLGSSVDATVILAGSSSIVCIKIYGDSNVVQDLSIRNDDYPVTAGTSVYAIRISPIDESNTITWTSISFNTIQRVNIYSFTEGVTLKGGGGSIVGFGDSTIFLNRLQDVLIDECYTGCALRPNSTAQYGPNSTVLYNVRFQNGTNIGLYIGGGANCRFFACTFEGILTGVGYGIFLDDVSGVTNGNHVFYSPTFESVTVPIISEISTYSVYSAIGLAGGISGTQPAYWVSDTYILAPNSYSDLQNLYASSSLGVGTTAPYRKFEVKGVNAKSAASEVVGAFRSNNSDGSQLALEISLGNTGSWTGITSTEFGVGGRDLVLQYGGGNVRPGTDNSSSMGTASYRWSVIYAATGTINTSDANQKTDIVDISDVEKRVAVKLKSSMKRFKFKDGKRYHFGTIAQDVKTAFESEGLVAEEYGVFCSDILENGSIRLGVRYEELFAFVIAVL